MKSVTDKIKVRITQLDRLIYSTTEDLRENFKAQHYELTSLLESLEVK